MTEMEKLRQRLHLSQKQLADRVGVTRQTIGLVERGQYNPSLKLCIKIARSLDSDLNTIFWRY